MLEIIGGILVLCIMILLSGIKVVKENSRLVIFRMGKLSSSKGPGVHLVLPIVENTELVDMRVKTLTTPIIECTSRDNFAVRLTAVCFYQIGDPLKSVRLENLDASVEALVQKLLRVQVQDFELDVLKTDSRRVGRKLKSEMEKQTRAWGLKIISVDLADVQAYSALKPNEWTSEHQALGLEQVEI